MVMIELSSMIESFGMIVFMLMELPESAVGVCCLDSSLSAVSAETLLTSGKERQQALTAWTLIGACFPAYEAALTWQHILACSLNI